MTSGSERTAQAVFDDHLHESQVGCMRFDYHTRLVAGELAFLEWTATSERAAVRDGADSYPIRDGRILAQTIHYTVEPLAGSAQPPPTGVEP